MPVVSEANATMLLSLYTPTETEVPQLHLPEPLLRAILRGGYIAGSSYPDFMHLRKKSVYMFNVGFRIYTHLELKGKIVLLKNRSDFITVRDANETYNYVVDPQKVLNLIGVGHLSDWVAAIDRHALNTLDFDVDNTSPEVKPMDLAKRKVLSFHRLCLQ